MLGPIVRISPYELHIIDSEYYDILYSRDSPRDKYWFYVRQFGIPLSGFATIDHTLHRQRRGVMNPFFAKQRINQLEPSIQALADKLCSRLDEFKGTGEVLKIRDAYSCFTADVVMDYTTGSSLNYLDTSDFQPIWSETMQGLAKMGAFSKQFPWFLLAMKSIPRRFVEKTNPGLALYFAFQDVSRVA
jgi:hypothetical protein